MFSSNHLRRILVVLAIAVMAQLAPALTPAAHAETPWQQDDIGIVMGGGTSELQAKIDQCLKLRDGDLDLWLPIGLQAKYDVARSTSPMSPLGMLLRVDFILDSRLGEWEELGCSELLGDR